jgi:hypothetical protein
MSEAEDRYINMQIMLLDAEKFSRAFEIMPAAEKEYIQHLSATYYAVLNNIIEHMEGYEKAEAFVLTLNEMARACYMFGYTKKTSTTILSKDSVIVNLN